MIAAAGLLACLLPASAQADLLSLYAEAHGGLASGDGIGGYHSNDAFHRGAKGVAYGALVGVEVLFIDAWVEHTQYQDSTGLAGTWTQFMTGLDIQFDVGQKTRGGTIDADGRVTGSDRYSPVYGEVGLAVGFGVGTGQQVMPPLDNSEITDKGFLAQGHLGLGYRLNRLMSIGIRIPVQSAYMFKSGEGGAANDESTHYRSVQGAALVNFRLVLNLR
ncbi:MAG: hypothetical protein MJE77_19700 [Proteobacteria bacterium]|nr:hypothetical protein [Pseudomonadota bacterium]